jgi:hypothetical protein
MKMKEEDEKSADILDDAPAAKSKNNGKKRALKKKLVMGRPVSKATANRREKILSLAKGAKGIDNITLAQKLGISTAQSQTVCRALVNLGELKMAKDKASGRVSYKTA